MHMRAILLCCLLNGGFIGSSSQNRDSCVVLHCYQCHVTADIYICSSNASITTDTDRPQNSGSGDSGDICCKGGTQNENNYIGNISSCHENNSKGDVPISSVIDISTVFGVIGIIVVIVVIYLLTRGLCMKDCAKQSDVTTREEARPIMAATGFCANTMFTKIKMLNKMLTVVILSSLLSRGFCVACPTKQFIERMSNNTVRCDLHTRINRCYWYLGSTSKTEPILKLEDGVKGGVKLEDEHYDITSECEMRILQAQIKHEAKYTYVAVLSNGSISREDISVILTVTPTPLCPRVSTCMLCKDCTLEFPINTSGTLVCSISGVRPPVSLYWIVPANGLIISRNESQYMKSNLLHGTWNSTAILEYSLTCEDDISITCQSKAWNKVISTNVRIKSETCNDGLISVVTSKDISSNIFSERPAILWILLSITAVVIVAVVVIISRMTHDRDKEAVQPATLTYQELKRGLKMIYSDNLIAGMEQLWTNCNCLLQTDNEKKKLTDVSLERILTRYFINENERVLFKGEPGVGKSYLFQQLLQRWIKKDDSVPEIIPIYFQLRHLSRKSCILHELFKALDMKCESKQSLRNILRDYESLILLDGFNDLPEEQEAPHTDEGSDSDDTILSVNNLLENTTTEFPKMKLWISSRRGKTDIKEPYKVVTLKGFNKRQLGILFDSCSRYYRNMPANEKKHNKDSENASLIPEGEPADLDYEWESLYSRQTREDEISPLVAYLFAFNFFQRRITGGQILPNSNSPVDISFDKDISVDNQYQVDWHLLACLFHSCNENNWIERQAKNLFKGKDVYFEKGTHGYRREAVITLCMTCRKLQIELQSLTFQNDYPALLDQCIPKITQELIFKNIKQDQKIFAGLVSNLSDKVKTIRFISCNLPKTITLDKIDKKTLPKVFLEEGHGVRLLKFKSK